MKAGKKFCAMRCFVKGFSHAQEGKERQDAARIFVHKRYAIAAAADGHGGKKYVRSRKGAAFAVEEAVKIVKDYMEDPNRLLAGMEKDQEFLFSRMQRQLVIRWHERIEKDIFFHPFTKAERAITDEQHAYGTTCMIAVMAEKFSFGFLIGDGSFVVLQDGKAKIPIEDTKSCANYTSSLCSANALTQFSSWFTKEPVDAVFVSTDGLIKSFDHIEDFQTYHLLLQSMLDRKENCRKHLLKNFRKRSKYGSGDDISMSFVYRRKENLYEKGSGNHSCKMQ